MTGDWQVVFVIELEFDYEKREKGERGEKKFLDFSSDLNHLSLTHFP